MAMAKTNKEIADSSIELMRRCVKYQMNRFPCKELKGDMLSDLYLILLDYDNEKLNDAYDNGHLNALYTRILINNIHSNTSKFYRDYRKFLKKADEIDNIIKNEDDDGIRDYRQMAGYRCDSSSEESDI